MTSRILPLPIKNFRLLPLLLLALTAPAQTPTHNSGPYRIAGTIVSAVDNHPLQHAKLQIARAEDKQPFQTTTSDEYGRFAFTAVPAGKFALAGDAPGYLHTAMDEHDGFNTAVVTGAGIDTESLVLKLLPESTISGVVVNESAEPVENASLHLFRENHNFGDGRFGSVGFANADDLGRFEFRHLEPGDYYLAVSAAPWYAVHPNPQQDPIQFRDASGNTGYAMNPGAVPRGSQPFGFADSIDPSLDVAYPITFYPGTTDPAAAQPIRIHGGESIDVSFELSPKPAVTLTVARKPAANGQPQNFPQLMTSFHGQPINPLSTQQYSNSSQVTFTGLAPGDYLLSDGRTQLERTVPGVPIHLSDSNTETTLPEAPDAAHVHITIKTADGSPLPSNVVVGLVKPHSTAYVSAVADTDGKLTLEAPPGDFYFLIDHNGQTFIRSILDGERPLPSNNIHVAAGASPFYTLTFSKGTHTLSGFARKDGHASPGSFVLLLPAADVDDIRTFFRDQSNLDGSFDLCCLAPGDYKLLAIDNGWDLDWQRPEILAHYLPGAVTVHISDTPAKIQTLPQPLPVQPH